MKKAIIQSQFEELAGDPAFLGIFHQNNCLSQIKKAAGSTLLLKKLNSMRDVFLKG
jgi:hypothetical protein